MRSVWMMGANESGRHPALASTIEVDTVVVGGGITGATTALLLAEAGQKVALLEAASIGASSTGHSTGNLYGTLSSGLSALRKHWSAEVVRDMVALRLQAVDRIEQTVARLAIDCAFARRPLVTCVAGNSDGLLSGLQEEFDAAAEAGLAPHWIDAMALPMPASRAFQIDRQAQFNPFQYTRAVAQAAAERGVLVHEHSAVVQVDPDAGRVVTASGEVHAQQIVLATHTPIGFNLVQAEMPVYRECGIAATLSQGPYPEGIFWVRDVFRSVRSYHAPAGDYLVVVGEKHKPGHEEPAEYEALRDYARAHFAVADFTQAWSAQQYRSADGLPYIGQSGHDKVLIATGFGADGLVWGTVAAQLIGELVHGRESEASERLTPRRFTPLKSAKNWAAETAVVLKDMVHRLSPAEVKDLTDVPAGEGRIAAFGGHKCAVYRSPEDELSVLSAVCTHLKCLVRWNSAAISWDCPCHGSRFRTDGSVIEGPALHPLPRVEAQ